MLYKEAKKLNHLFNKDLMSTYYVLFIYSSTINTEVIKTDQVPAYYIVGGGRETLPRKEAVIRRQSTHMPGLSTWDLPPALSCLDKHIPCRPSHLGTIVPRVMTYLQLLHIITARVLPFLPVTFIFKKSWFFFWGILGIQRISECWRIRLAILALEVTRRDGVFFINSFIKV